MATKSNAPGCLASGNSGGIRGGATDGGGELGGVVPHPLTSSTSIRNLFLFPSIRPHLLLCRCAALLFLSSLRLTLRAARVNRYGKTRFLSHTISPGIKKPAHGGFIFVGLQVIL
jgi:hypothetical protein